MKAKQMTPLWTTQEKMKMLRTTLPRSRLMMSAPTKRPQPTRTLPKASSSRRMNC